MQDLIPIACFDVMFYGLNSQKAYLYSGFFQLEKNLCTFIICEMCAEIFNSILFATDDNNLLTFSFFIPICFLRKSY